MCGSRAPATRHRVRFEESPRPSLGAKGASPRVQVRVDPDLAKTLRARAHKEHRSISEIARTLYASTWTAPPNRRRSYESIQSVLEQLTAAMISAEFHVVESTQEVRDVLDHRRGLREAELAALRDGASPKDVLFVPTAGRLTTAGWRVRIQKCRDVRIHIEQPSLG